MSDEGGQALVGKWGRVPDGGIDQIFVNWGDPPREKTLLLPQTKLAIEPNFVT